MLLPLLTEKDPRDSAEGGLDPLGFYSISDALGVKLVPGVRERQSHPRFLTSMAVSLAVCEGLEDLVASDGVSTPRLVFEWYLVEGMVRAAGMREEMEGVPGSLKARKAKDDGVPLSARRYLKTPGVFGFHGIYRLLARSLGIEQGDRLGEAGFELLRVWEREQGQAGFASLGGGGPGVTMRKQLREAVEAGLHKASTARSPAWAGWSFFQTHLNIQQAGTQEARFIADLLLQDVAGHRGDLLQFLVSKPGWKLWSQHGDERTFHAAMRRQAGAELSLLLAAITAYETFARLCLDAFDDMLVELTRTSAKTSPKSLAALPSMKLASQRVPELFGEVMAKLEPFDQVPRFVQSFATLAERGSAVEWVERLAEHHRRVQRSKPPDGKNAWFERFDDGSFIIRPLYRRDEGGRHDESYVHAYRTGALASFAKDLQLTPA
jgi:hypothetical protein